MDCQSTDIFEIYKLFSSLTENGITEMDNCFQIQSSKLDTIYNELLQSAQNVPEKNISKRQSKTKIDQVGDLFAAEPSFQQPAVPPVRRTTRQASIIASDKIKGIRESSTISSFGSSTRASRARALSTFMDIASIACPTANSTFVIDKKVKRNFEEPVSPGMFSPDIGTHIKETNANKTYDLTKRLSAKNPTKKLEIIVDLPEESSINTEQSNSKQPETLIYRPEKSKSALYPKALPSNISTSSATLPKSKIDNKNDYGLNDVSARDSSEDESGPKKPVPNWAKRENRKAVLELQYYVDSKERDLFFDCPKSMSLKEMFKGWNIRDKQRTSSAVWNTPPRYSEYSKY
ncbi:PREDICTED: uncharacterized protein LOC107166938 [Diuraphis noxia]|uniref:uncharacterized protein LOC107166938 n=1 Tax=Diuraphis noxia TaxID=143948 RepID=UPI0007635876|nr:PREDICTED: uncharacterized protein LOC107166938 [Diuraphis noxia]